MLLSERQDFSRYFIGKVRKEGKRKVLRKLGQVRGWWIGCSLSLYSWPGCEYLPVSRDTKGYFESILSFLQNSKLNLLFIVEFQVEI